MRRTWKEPVRERSRGRQRVRWRDKVKGDTEETG